MIERCSLLAGSVGPERLPVHPDPEHADWYLPLHLRDAHVARERLVGQIVAGADVVMAPAWLTHRRALLPLGETRRAAAWTAAAVRLGREAIESGLERREERAAEGTDDPLPRGRPRPLLAAPLPALDDGAPRGDGRLLPREPATERDYRDQAGIIADAEPDLILVEAQPDQAEGRLAMIEAAQTGLPTWLALPQAALAAADPGAWLEVAEATGVARVLLPGPPAERGVVAGGPLPWGAVAPDPRALGDWLDRGADCVALLDGATSRAVARLRDAIDAHERPLLEGAEAAERRWQRAIKEAAARAPGGTALWLGPAPAWSLPAGFDWLIVGPEEAPLLPSDHFCLAVVAAGRPGKLGPLLRRGGLLIERSLRPHELRRLQVEDTAEPPIATYRRED